MSRYIFVYSLTTHHCPRYISSCPFRLNLNVTNQKRESLEKQRDLTGYVPRGHGVDVRRGDEKSLDNDCNDIVIYYMFCAVVREEKKKGEKLYIKERIYYVFAVARAIHKRRNRLESCERDSAPQAMEYVRYFLCYDVILYLLNKTSK